MMAVFSLSFSLSAVWRRGLLALLVVSFLSGAAWGQGASYSSASIVIETPGSGGPYGPVGSVNVTPVASSASLYSLKSATLSLPESAGGDETAPIRVTMKGLSVSTGTERSYTWVWGSHESKVWSSYNYGSGIYKINDAGESVEVLRWNSAEGGVFLRWFWNGEPIDSYAGSLLVGSAGTYRVELWQTRTYYQSGPVEIDDNNVKISEGYYRSYQMLDSMTFEGILHEPAPLEEGAPPQFTEVPDLPEVMMVPKEGLKLAVKADAGGPFMLRWYRDRVLKGLGRELVVRPSDVNQAGNDYYCEASGLTGKVVTRNFRLRAPMPVMVDFTASVCAVGEGGTVRLDPKGVSETPVTYAWTGPALTAGYAGARVLEDGTLEITEARVEDAGNYILTVTNAELTATHQIPVSVVRMPSGTYPLRVGECVMMEGIENERDVVYLWQQREEADSSAALSWPEWYGTRSYATVAKLGARMEGEYHCWVNIEPQLPKSTWDSGYLKILKLPAPSFELASDFEMRLPWEEPVMPEHELPVGQVGAYYFAPKPVRVAGAGSAAVRYQVSGLPRGLKALPDGSVSGHPLQAGLFPVKFVAVNKQGRSAPVEVMLSVIPLPEGTAGEWLAFSTGYGKSWTMKINTTSLGTFTARGPQGPAVGRVSEYDGKVDLSSLRGRIATMKIQPGTNLMEVSNEDGFAAGRGWRNVWSRANRPEVYAGRYNFYAQPLVSPREGEVCVETGYRSGTALVEATGRVKTLFTGERGVATTSSFFLGPQGQILHEHKDRKVKSDHYCIELAIDETGQEIQGQLPVYNEDFKSPAGQVYFNYQRERALWPGGLAHVYAGRRYTPPAAGALPAGFSVPETGANARLTLGLPEAQTALFPALKGAVTAEAQPWLLAKGGRMRLTGPATHEATSKVHLPTGMFSGKVQFADGSKRPPVGKFQGFLVPQADGEAVIGYGATEPASGWETLPVTLEAAAEE